MTQFTELKKGRTHYDPSPYLNNKQTNQLQKKSNLQHHPCNMDTNNKNTNSQLHIKQYEEGNLQTKSQNGLSKLQNVKGVYLKEINSRLEQFCAIKMPVNFELFPADEQGNQVDETPIFKSSEKSSCPQRMILPPNCRSYELFLDNHEVSDSSSPFLRLSRNFKCSIFCYNRPEIECHIIEDNKEVYIGKLVNPFFWCDLGAQIFDKTGNLKFTVQAFYKQYGVLCRMFSCKACQIANFDVKSPSGQILTTVVKRDIAFLDDCCTNCDNFSLVFPPDSTVEDKALLIAAILLIDFSYFEDTPQTKNLYLTRLL